MGEVTVSRLYRLTVADKPLAQLVQQARLTGVTPDDLASLFAVLEGTITVEGQVLLVCLDAAISTEDARQQLDQRGFVPLGPEWLVVWGYEYLGGVHNYVVVALGATSKDGKRILTLDNSQGTRCLALGWAHASWTKSCRFLVTRKQ